MDMVEDVEQEMVVYQGGLDLSQTSPLQSLEKAEEVVRYMSDRCKGPAYISNIQGRNYPKVEWWTTVGMSVGLFPREVSCDKLEREGETAYLATVEVCRGDQVITRASAMCSSRERTWSNRDEYAIKSMATTRATGKAYRIGLSGLAVMAGLEPTPAEEMPHQGVANPVAQASDKQIGFLRNLSHSSHLHDEEKQAIAQEIEKGLDKQRASALIERTQALIEERQQPDPWDKE